jgi:hypothetical protein
MTTVGRDNRGMRKTNGGRKPRFSRGGSKVHPKHARNSHDRLRAIVRRRATSDKNCFSIYDALP